MLEQNPLTAIDILLQPDATMLRRAQANNTRLLKVFPKGFALDQAHRPHITLIQRFVLTLDLDRVYAAAEKVLAAATLLVGTSVASLVLVEMLRRRGVRLAGVLI
jgi:hypothetical protein